MYRLLLRDGTEYGGYGYRSLGQDRSVCRIFHGENSGLTLIAAPFSPLVAEDAGIGTISLNKMDNGTINSSATVFSTRRWFALKVFFNKVFETEDALRQRSIESYFPCEEVLVVRNGVRKKIHRPMVSSLLFFRSTVRQALELQSELAGKVLLYTRQKGMKKLPIAIPDREMNIFMLVTSSGERGLEYLGDDHPKYHRGERVRVIDGPFKGAEGHICRIKKNHCLVVAIEGICAVATSYIPRCFLEKLS